MTILDNLRSFLCDIRRIREALERLSPPYDIRHKRDGDLYRPRTHQSEK